MKLMIDIPDKDYEKIKDGHIPFSILDVIQNGIPIPDNATNGDVLKRFLYGKAIVTEFIHDVNISVNNNVIGQFDMEWWNAPYERGEME